MDAAEIGQAGRVLVVDDERMQLVILSRMLAISGTGSDCAENLADARARLKTQRYDALILDLSLRGEDSLSFLHSVVEAGQQPRVIFISGMDRRVREASSRVAHGLGLPVLGTLCKPVDPHELALLLSADPRRPVADGPAEAAPPTASDLSDALDEGAIAALYQPKIVLATGALVGVEALARWTRPDGRVIPPDVFIPLAEASGLIGRLTDQVLEQALAAGAALRRRIPGCTMAVNLSPLCLRDPGLTDRIEAALRAHHLPPGALTLELTESSAADDRTGAAEILTRLRIRGFGLSIDDFGTGHSSLLALLRLPFGELKIDKSFVLGSRDDPEALKIVRATLALARELGLRTVAEGVETRELAAAMQRLGCDIGQGWLFDRPVAPAAVKAFYPTPAPLDAACDAERMDAEALDPEVNPR